MKAQIDKLDNKKVLIALKAEVENLDINKLVIVSTSLSNSKTNLDDLDVGKLKTVPIDLKKLSHIVGNEVAKNTKFNTLKTKVNNLEKKVTDARTLTYINQYYIYKKNLDKEIGDINKKFKIPMVY